MAAEEAASEEDVVGMVKLMMGGCRYTILCESYSGLALWSWGGSECLFVSRRGAVLVWLARSCSVERFFIRFFKGGDTIPTVETRQYCHWILSEK